MSSKDPKPLRIRSHHIEIAALDYGNEGARPMLLVHGMRDLAWSLDPLARHFADRYRVIAIDQRGHGDSDHVGYYALSHFVIDLWQVVRRLQLEAPILVGHSFGGEVASQLAGLFPEVPSALVLLEGLGPPPWEAEGSREAGLYWARSAIEALDKIDLGPRTLPDLETATRRVRENHPGLDPERARFLAEKGTRPLDGKLAWKWDPFLRTSWGSFNFQQIEACWQRVECPTLAVNGGASGEFWRRDMGPSLRRETGRGADADGYLPPDELQRRLDCFSDVECTEVPGAGHMVHFDAPDAVNAAVDEFLTRRGI